MRVFKFWYSEKQREMLSLDKSPKNVALIDGKEVTYTAMSGDVSGLRCKWDDMTYLGEGRWLKVDGTW